LSYATTAELISITGSSLQTSILQALLDEADRQIKSRLASAEVSAPDTDDKLKSACLALGKASILDRMRMDGSHVSDPQYSWSAAELNDAIKHLRDEAWEFVDSYILTSQTQRYKWNIRKVNA